MARGQMNGPPTRLADRRSCTGGESRPRAEDLQCPIKARIALSWTPVPLARAPCGGRGPLVDYTPCTGCTRERRAAVRNHTAVDMTCVRWKPQRPWGVKRVAESWLSINKIRQSASVEAGSMQRQSGYATFFAGTRFFLAGDPSRLRLVDDGRRSWDTRCGDS